MKQKLIFLNRVHACCLLLAALCFTLPLSATDYYCDFSVNGIHYKFIRDKQYEVAVSYENYETGRYGGNYTNYSGNVTVPAAITYNGTTYKVTAVSDHAFYELTSVTSVTLPSTIKSIGAAAFADCTALFNVNMPSSLDSIGVSAFNGCVNLGSVQFPNGLRIIGNNAFANCQSLRSATIPNSVTYIGGSAFSGCANLSAVTTPQDVETVGDNAFLGTPWIAGQNGLVYIGKVLYKYAGVMPEGTDIVIKDGTVGISSSAFSGCSGMASVVIPESVTSIGSAAFTNCTSLTSIAIPKNVQFWYAGSTSPFNGCTALKRVDVQTTAIESYLFRGLSSLEQVTLGDTVERIGQGAFYFCTGLASVVIPENVKQIDSDAFSMCTSLADVTIENPQATIASSAFNGTPWMENQPGGMMYVGHVAYRYIGTMPAGTHINIKDGTVAIADNAFYSCEGLVSINLPASVKTIGNYAFSNCKGLTGITFSEGLESIGGSAFNGCTNITNITIPKNIKKIDSNAFSGCTQLSELTLADGIEAIGPSAFSNCSSLHTITIPGSVHNWQTGVFSGCSNLETVVLSEGISIVPSSSFSNCSKLTSVTLPGSLADIETYAFSGCNSLSNITIPKNVKSIGDYAFSGCSITSVTAQMIEPVSINSTTFSYSYVSYANNITLYVPAGSGEAYRASETWKDFKEILEFVMPTDITSLTDAIYAEAATALKGSSGTMTICLKNVQPTNAYSFDLVLPDGVTVDGYTLSSRHNGHSETMNSNATTNVYSFAVLSLQSKELKDNDGAIWTLKLKVADGVAAGDYAVSVQNAKYSLTSGSTSVSLPDVTSLLTIEDYKKGDANGDGAADIADAVCIVNHVVGKDTPSYVAAAADANGDGVVDIADAVRVVNLVVGKIDALSRGLKADFGYPEPQ